MVDKKMSKMKTIAVIGGGSAGLSAARAAKAFGARVLFFMGDDADHASLCINAGCMPSKAMFEPIDAMHRAKRHGWLEVKPVRPEEFLSQIIAWKDQQIAGFNAHRQQEIRDLQSNEFTIIRATARFVDSHRVRSQNETYTFDAAIIATGSINHMPPFVSTSIGLDGVWTSNEILHNTRRPKSMIVLGAGAVALEFSLRYARLGCAVTVVSRSPIMPRFPLKYGERLREIYEREGVRMLPGRKIVRFTRVADGFFNVEIEGTQGAETLRAERVLLATGRRPALRNLNLKVLGLETDERGRLRVGDDMRVHDCENIFAAGDVVGQRMVVHHAHIEAGIAGENAVKDGNRKWARRSNVQVVFSDPEFAFAGQSPETAEKAGHKIVTATAESRDIGKLHLAGDDFGFGEFVADADDGRLLGAGLLCDDAANLIHLPAYAIDHQHTIHALIDGEYYHPTKIEIVSEIGDALFRALGGTPFFRATE
jgi:pyruvate/2-oxoglutarate dehydrogenase complex dihydrolipoamide dehydrogenase (E3) component